MATSYYISEVLDAINPVRLGWIDRVLGIRDPRGWEHTNQHLPGLQLKLEPDKIKKCIEKSKM